MSSVTLSLLQESNHVLGDHHALDAAFARDGYLFFRDVLDRAAVATVTAGVIDFLSSEGVVEPNSSTATWTGREAEHLGAHPPALHSRRLWEGLMAAPTTVAFMTTVFGEAPVTIPIAQYQFKTPRQDPAAPWATAHQDHFFNPGLHFRTFWIPLVDIDASLGGLTLAAGCHTNGVLHDTSQAGAPLDHRAIPAEAWSRADYHPGDVVIFHGSTPHGGLPNQHRSQLRLSVDMRAQPMSAPTPAIGLVTHVEGRIVTVTSDDGRQTSLTIDDATVVRTDLAITIDPAAFLGHRVIAAGQNGRAILIRSAA